MNTKLIFHRDWPLGCRLFLLLLMCFLMSVQAGAQTSYSRLASSIVSKYKKQIQQSGKQAIALPTDSVNVVMSPYIYQLMGPGIYFSSALKDGFRLDAPDFSGNFGFSGISENSGISRLPGAPDQILSLSSHALMRAYISHPNAFRYSDAQINSEHILATLPATEAKKEDLVDIYNKVDEIKDVTDIVDDVELDLHIQKPNFWTTTGKFSLQFTQNYFSEQWYKGGNNNVTLLSGLQLEANYNDQKRLSWDNKLDLRLGFVTATSDSIHRYLTNNDKIDLYSKLGVKATKSWYYTLSVEGKTQFLPGYRSNDRRAYSRFFAPLDANASLGMDFKPSLKNGNTFSLALLPFSYKMRYIGDEEETIHASFNMKDKDFQQDFGSRIELNSKLTLAKNFLWRCRFYTFTSYEYVEGEMENVFTFQFNKYISSEIYTLWRFDDNRDMKYWDDTLGYFQFKEYFTLGLSYNF